MKRINSVVVCENKRLDDPEEFNTGAQTAKLLFQALKCPIQTNPSNTAVQLVLSLPHCVYFHGFAKGEVWMLCVRFYLTFKVNLDILMMASRLHGRKRSMFSCLSRLYLNVIRQNKSPELSSICSTLYLMNPSSKV